MTSLKRLAAIAGALVLCSTGWAATAVPRIRSVNLSEADLNLVSGLLFESYQRFSAVPVTTSIEGATEFIEALAYGLGPDATWPILVRAERRSELGVVLAHAELRIETPWGAPVAFDRLAAALAHRALAESVEPGARLATTQARRAVSLLGVKLGWVVPLASGHAFNGLAVVMFDARLEKDTYFFEVGAGFALPGPSPSPYSNGYGGFVAELGASRYLTFGETAIYAGGGVLPRLLFSGGVVDSPFNLAPYGQVGVMLDRSSSMRLYADLRVAQNVLAVRASAGAGQGAFPTELSGQIGVGW